MTMNIRPKPFSSAHKSAARRRKLVTPGNRRQRGSRIRPFPRPVATAAAARRRRSGRARHARLRSPAGPVGGRRRARHERGAHEPGVAGRRRVGRVTSSFRSRHCAKRWALTAISSSTEFGRGYRFIGVLRVNDATAAPDCLGRERLQSPATLPSPASGEGLREGAPQLSALVPECQLGRVALSGDGFPVSIRSGDSRHDRKAQQRRLSNTPSDLSRRVSLPMTKGTRGATTIHLRKSKKNSSKRMASPSTANGFWR